jgi:hypothetical protein
MSDAPASNAGRVRYPAATVAPTIASSIGSARPNAMLNDSILIENLIEDLQRSATVDHVVFRNDLKPIHHRLLRQDVIVVPHSQTNSHAVVGISIETIGRHV